jgi:hypothetical protein
MDFSQSALFLPLSSFNLAFINICLYAVPPSVFSRPPSRVSKGLLLNKKDAFSPNSNNADSKFGNSQKNTGVCQEYEIHIYVYIHVHILHEEVWRLTQYRDRINSTALQIRTALHPKCHCFQALLSGPDVPALTEELLEVKMRK